MDPFFCKIGLQRPVFFSFVCILEVITAYQSGYKVFPLQVISQNKNITNIFINVWNQIIVTEQSFEYKDHRMGNPSLSSINDTFQEGGEQFALPFFTPSQSTYLEILSKLHWVTSNTLVWRHHVLSENSKRLHRKALKNPQRSSLGLSSHNKLLVCEVD